MYVRFKKEVINDDSKQGSFSYLKLGQESSNLSDVICISSSANAQLIRMCR